MMNTPSTSSPSLTHLPDNVPWDQTVALLVDALRVPNLLQRIYEWSANPHFDVVYHSTQWAEIDCLSPCLVQLRDRNDPILLHYLANVQSQWGYLLVSDGSWDELLAHMRWLTSIKPAQEDEMFLRISDPAVARALFAAECHPGGACFGPCRLVIVADTLLGRWMQFTRPGEKMVPPYDQPYRANDAQWAALKAGTFDKFVGDIQRHVQRLFPAYRAGLTSAEHLAHVHRLVASAIEKGFTGAQEISLYANVLGFLGDDSLEQHADIHELLTVSSPMTNLQRIDHAATLAAQRSVQ